MMKYCHFRLILLTSLLFSSFFNELMAIDVTAFYPSALSPKERSRAFKKVGISATVFANVADFDKSLISPGDAVVAPDAFSNYQSGFDEVISLSPTKGKGFRFLILSMDSKLKMNQLGKKKIGIVKVIKKKKILRKYVQKILGNSKIKKIKTVSKSEDLFPLLVFKAADAVMISPRDYDILKKKYQTKVYIIGKSNHISYPKVFVKSGTDKKSILSTFSKLSSSQLKELGL